MTASFRVHYQFPNLLFRGGTLDGHCERDTLKGGAGAFQAHFVRHVKRATNVDFTILYWNIVKVREPRNLREQSKGGANKKIREWSGSLVGATSLFRFIGFEAKTPYRPLQMDPFNNISYRPKRYFPLVWSDLGTLAKLIKLDTHLFQVHTALNLIAHLVSSWSKGLSRFSNTNKVASKLTDTINEKRGGGIINFLPDVSKEFLIF